MAPCVLGSLSYILFLGVIPQNYLWFNAQAITACCFRIIMDMYSFFILSSICSINFLRVDSLSDELICCFNVTGWRVQNESHLLWSVPIHTSREVCYRHVDLLNILILISSLLFEIKVEISPLQLMVSFWKPVVNHLLHGKERQAWKKSSERLMWWDYFLTAWHTF